MEEQSLLVFAKLREGLPLQVIQDALQRAGYPAEWGIGILGKATEADLAATDWEAAILRWTDPELHEVAYLERDLRSEDEEVEALLIQRLRDVMHSEDQAGAMIVADHLRRTQTLYSLQILPALLDEDDHPAWAALDVILRTIATHTEGLIAVPGEGFCDRDGELLLAEADNESEEEPEEA